MMTDPATGESLEGDAAIALRDELQRRRRREREANAKKAG